MLNSPRLQTVGETVVCVPWGSLTSGLLVSSVPCLALRCLAVFGHLMQRWPSRARAMCCSLSIPLYMHMCIVNYGMFCGAAFGSL